MEQLDEIRGLLEIEEFFDYQESYFGWLIDNAKPDLRTCLYYKTGAGKSITALVGLRLMGWWECAIIAPPATHESWKELARQLNMRVECMSHAKFRMKSTKMSRHQPVIADEFHLFGGHSGQGWKKLDRLSQGLQAPLVLASATPNYNDAERVYCVSHILDPAQTSGGYLQFLYTHCITKQNPFAQTPIVEGFQNFTDASEFLASLNGVFYIPDDAKYIINELTFGAPLPRSFTQYRVNRSTGRFMASQMEERHTRKRLQFLDASGRLRVDALAVLETQALVAGKTTLLFCESATIAEGVFKRLNRIGYSAALVTGKTPTKEKAQILNAFRQGHLRMLVGTATLATGTDGFDKVCDTLIIVDDTDDDSLRRQLIGRILHRGAGSAATPKQIFRLQPVTTSQPRGGNQSP